MRDFMNPIPLGIYRHYKGNKYEVVGFAKNSETLEDMVVYIHSTVNTEHEYARSPCGITRLRLTAKA